MIRKLGKWQRKILAELGENKYIRLEDIHTEYNSNRSIKNALQQAARKLAEKELIVYGMANWFFEGHNSTQKAIILNPDFVQFGNNAAGIFNCFWENGKPCQLTHFSFGEWQHVGDYSRAGYTYKEVKEKIIDYFQDKNKEEEFYSLLGFLHDIFPDRVRYSRGNYYYPDSLTNMGRKALRELNDEKRLLVQFGAYNYVGNWKKNRFIVQLPA